jgi:hypothetical protein
VSFSGFALPKLFPAVPKASGPVFKFCAPGLIFGGTEGVGSRFHVLRARTHFRRYRGRPLPFSFSARPDSFFAVLRASALVFMFCALGVVSCVTEGVVSLFQVLRSRTRFRTTAGIGCRFHVLCVLTRFQRKRGCRVPFSCFALPASFPAVPRASGPIFMFFAPGLVFGGIAGIGSRFQVLCTRTRFQRYPGRRLQFSSFVLPDSFSASLRASAPVFMFYAPELIFDGNEGVRSRFIILRSRTCFRRCRSRWVTFSCFSRPNSFSAVPTATGPIFMFCAPRLYFDGTEGVGSRFNVLRARTRFRLYRGRRLPFSCFARPDSFSEVPRASCAVLMFCPLGLVFDGIEGVRSCFHVFLSRTCFRRSRGRRVSFSCFARQN